jgi:hypothetical protein
MPGIKIRIDADEARIATEKLSKDLKDLGLQTKLTDKEIKTLESRLKAKMGADKGKEAMDRLATSVGLTRVEILKLTQAQTGSAFATMEKGVSMIRGGFMSASIAAAGFAAAVFGVMKVWETAGKALQAETAFDAITKSLNMDGEALKKNMKAAAAGTMDDSDIMQASLRALVQDIEGLEDKLPDLMAGARTAAKITGDTVSEQFEKLVQGIATDMPRGLRAMGAVTKEQMTLINQAYAVGITNIKLGDIAISNLNAKAALFNTTTTSSYENLQKFRAELHELKEWAAKGGLVILEKLGAVFMQIGVRIEAAAAKAKMLNAQVMRSEAEDETDPVKKAKMLKEATEMEVEARNMAVDAYNKEQLSREQLTGKPAKLITPAMRQVMDNPDKNMSAYQLSKSKERAEYVERKAKEEEKANTEKLRQQINEIEEKKQFAENLKNIDASELRGMEARSQAGISILKMRGQEESRVETQSIAEKEKLNEAWYQRRLKEIDAEAEAKKAATKNWTDEDKNKWATAEKNVAKYEIQARRAETAAAKDVNKVREEVERLNQEWEISHTLFARSSALYEQKTQTMTAGLEHLQAVTKQQIAFEQELSNIRARYGDITPKQQVEEDFDSRKKYIEMEQASLKLKMQRLADKGNYTEEDEIEGLRITNEQFRLEKQLIDLEKLRAARLKEFVGTWKEGMETGLKRFRVEIGSEFQIWETFACDSAKAMSGAFEEFFFDALSGRMKTFSDYWQAFADGLRRALSQALSKELMNTIFDSAGGSGGLSSLLSMGLASISGGSMGGWADIPGEGTLNISGGDIPFARAKGGPVSAGSPYMVGEQGPEMFVPKAGGTIVPNGSLGGMTITVPISINGGGSKAMISELRSEMEKTAESVVRRHS